jgi:hypothetical protein
MRKRLRSLVSFLRGAVVVLALLGYLAASIGFPAPLPTVATGKDAKHVQVRPCGCVVTEEESQCCCCKTSPDCSMPPHDAEMQADSKDEFVFLIGEQVRHCQGLDGLWSSIATALPLPPPVECAYDDQPILRHFSRQHFPESLAPCPPAPPPRG